MGIVRSVVVLGYTRWCTPHTIRPPSIPPETPLRGGYKLLTYLSNTPRDKIDIYCAE